MATGLRLLIENLITAVATDVTKLTKFTTGSNAGTDLSVLTTVDKTSLPAAINEVKAGQSAAGAQIVDTGPSSTTVYSSTKTDAQIAATSTTDRARANHTGTQTASTISDFGTAADARIAVQKGANSGLASLDSGGRVPTAQLPAYVDDIVEYANRAAFPATGVAGILYEALDTNHLWRYNTGSSNYIDITLAGMPASSDALAEGTTNQYYTAARSAANLKTANNLSDVANAATARTNLSVYSQTEIGDVTTSLVAIYNAAKSA